MMTGTCAFAPEPAKGAMDVQEIAVEPGRACRCQGDPVTTERQQREEEAEEAQDSRGEDVFEPGHAWPMGAAAGAA